MKKIYLESYELEHLALFRIALSEPDMHNRLKAIEAVRTYLRTELQGLASQTAKNDPGNALATRLTKNLATSDLRDIREAAFCFAEVNARFEKRHQTKLNVAEQVGLMIYLSIRDGIFRGVQSDTGILSEVRELGTIKNVRGAKDKDTVRKAWADYRGVVHLGMAQVLHEENRDIPVFELAEHCRRALSSNCPRRTETPYVPPEEQISFLSLSML